ncbi:MAG: hypothetical protein WBG90_09990 [Saonia sp.]
MKNNVFLITLMLSLCSVGLRSQSTFEDAKHLVAFKKLYELNQEKITQPGLSFTVVDQINLARPEVQESLAKLVLSWFNTGARPITGQGPNGAVALGGAVPQGIGGQPSRLATDSNLNVSVLQKIQEEIQWYIAFAETDALVFDDNKTQLKTLENFPKSFQYLQATVSVLETGMNAGSLTASAGLGSIVSISQAEILKGITDWALDRAEKELMQAFLQDWLDRLDADPLLQEIFPNTLNMLSTKSITTFFTDGDTWKATFQQDFDQLPAHIPKIADLALREAGEPISIAKKKELISGLSTAVTLFEALGNNKRPEETLQLLSQEAFLRANKLKVHEVATIDRTVMGIGTLIASIQNNSGAVPSFINPSEVLALSKTEMQVFWKLLFIRERTKLKYTFNLKNPDAEMMFYRTIRDTLISDLQLRLAHVAEGIQGMNTLVNKIAKSQNQSFTKEAFHNYVTLTFEFLELGVTTLEHLGVNTLDSASLALYKEKYLVGYQQVSQIIEGIKTKQYGIVVLNTVNLLSWIKDLASQERIVGQVEVYVSKVTEDIDAANLAALATSLSSVTNQHLSNYPDTKEIVERKLKDFEEALKKEENTVPKDRVLELLRFHLRLTIEEHRVMLKEMASGFLTLQKTSEAVHRYGNLMVNIVMAENSEDIENALEVAAMETGGYLVKQNSKFSATVSFFPGIEYGWEQIDSSGGQDGDGSFIGATLPIGVEFAWGTGWKSTIGAVGVFVQVLDLGAVLNYSLENDNNGLANRTDFGFKEVLSPGSFLVAHLKNVPVSLGVGVSYSPSLREIGMDDTTIDANALQWGFFLGVDLNVFTLFGSDTKISLEQKP